MKNISKAVIKDKKIKFELFPLVYKNSEMGLITIVYSNRSETFKYLNTYNGENDNKYNSDNEINMLTGNGFKKVNYGKITK